MSDMRTATATVPASLSGAAAGEDPEREQGPRVRPITVAEYRAMGEAGIFGPDERVELVDGLLIVPPPQNVPHVSVLMRMQYRLHERLAQRAMIAQQLPVVVSDRSEPEPDFALIRWRDDYYARAKPTAADTFAIVEVADATLRMDRGRKRRVYARAGIPEYWIVNVRARQIEIHRDPHGGAYPAPRIAKPGEVVSFAAFPDVVFTVDELLG